MENFLFTSNRLFTVDEQWNRNLQTFSMNTCRSEFRLNVKDTHANHELRKQSRIGAGNISDKIANEVKNNVQLIFQKSLFSS